MSNGSGQTKVGHSLRRNGRGHAKESWKKIRASPISAVAFRRMVTRLGPTAKMPFPIHPHMLRHSTGFKLANQGVDTWSLQHYLGHENIQHPVRYSELSPERFRDFWKD
jgi:type 1 fimbriae regulatory protein FimB/type 1 fimbriae regulatory protein FimE